MALAVLVLALLGLVAARLERFDTLSRTGQAKVNDGDSLMLGGERIRLRGIDAPELSQTCRRDGADYACGRLSRQALLGLIDGGAVLCEGWERDRYRRLLAICSAGGVELNSAQVTAGWAVAYGGYAKEEARARGARLGLWAGEFEQPRDWRVSHGDMVDAPHDSFGALANWMRQLFAG